MNSIIKYFKMVTVIILVVIFFIGKFIYDTFLTDNTERKWEDYKSKELIRNRIEEESNSRFFLESFSNKLTGVSNYFPFVEDFFNQWEGIFIIDKNEDDHLVIKTKETDEYNPLLQMEYKEHYIHNFIRKDEIISVSVEIDRKYENGRILSDFSNNCSFDVFTSLKEVEKALDEVHNTIKNY